MMRIHQVDPQEEGLILQSFEPFNGMTNQNISRGITTELVHRDNPTTRKPLAVMEIEFVVDRSRDSSFSRNTLKLTIQLRPGADSFLWQAASAGRFGTHEVFK